MNTPHLRQIALVMAALLFSSCQQSVHAENQDNMLKNPGFEERSGSLPSGWTINKNPKGHAELVSDKVHSGSTGLKLIPNNKNTSTDLAQKLLSADQGFPADRYRGKKLYVSSWMAADPGATAVITVIALRGNQMPGIVRLAQTPTTSFVHQEGILNVPDDAKAVVLLCIVEGTSGAAYFDDVVLSENAPAASSTAAAARPSSIEQASSSSAVIHVQADHVVRTIPATLYGTNTEWIWNANGLWDEDRRSFRPELVNLTRNLHVSVIRFPGGIFADFYHWKNGIGPQNKRKTARSFPSGTDSQNSVGTDEITDFAQQVGAQLMFTVNIVTGTPEEAAAWVEYVNSRSSGVKVKYWELGNESYLNGGMEFQKKAAMSPNEYAKKFLLFAKAMRAVDPEIKLGAISDANIDPRITNPDWTPTLLRTAGTQIDFLAVHNAYAPAIDKDQNWSVETVYGAMLAAPILIKRNLSELRNTIRSTVPERAGRIQIAVTEWGPYFEIVPSSRWVDHGKTLGSALYVASAMKAFIESPDVDIANYFQLVDSLYMGSIGFRNGEPTPKASYFALQMYTTHFGQLLVDSTTVGPTYTNEQVGRVTAIPGVPYLETVSSLSGDRRTLYLMVINKNLKQAIPAKLRFEGFSAQPKATVWQLNGTAIDANTGTQMAQNAKVKWGRQASVARFGQGGPGEVRVEESTLQIGDGRFNYEFPAHSVTAIEIHRR
jgi:alpha-L-arabinofuranosidase